jgi:hypothetical protein
MGMTETTTPTEPLHLQQANPYAHPLNKTEGKATVFYGQERFGGPFGWFTPGGFTRNEMDAQFIVEAMDRLIRENEA